MVNKACVRVNGSLAAIIFMTAFAAASPASAGGLIYVNRCPSGCTVMGGPDNAVNGTSTIFTGSKNLSAFAHGDAIFSETVTCLRSVFARYDVDVITTNPGAVARREMMLAGAAAQLGQPAGVPGVAPTGSSADNRIAFAFANDIGPDADKLCWIAAQQLAFLYGLDNEYYCPDIMTYGTGCGLKTFADFDAPCGTDAPVGSCPISGQPTQNSAGLLTVRAGLSDRVFLNEFELPRPAP